MTTHDPAHEGGWRGAASWDDVPASGPAAVEPSSPQSPASEPAVGAADGPDAGADDDARLVEGRDAVDGADATVDERLARAREILRRAERGEATDSVVTPQDPPGTGSLIGVRRPETGPAVDPGGTDEAVEGGRERAPGATDRGDEGAGVPDFLPPGTDARPTGWADLTDGPGRPATHRDVPTRGPGEGGEGPEPGAETSRRGRGRPAAHGEKRRRGRVQEPPSTGAAAVDRDADPEDFARQIVLRQLAMAPRSRAQLEEKLRQRDCPPDVAARVLDRMTEVGLVDDEAYASMLVRSRQATKGLARRALAQELRRKGIDKDLADVALEEVDEADERRIARELVDKRLRSMGGLSVQVQTRRLAGMLARKGYSSGLAYAVIRDAIADAPEHQRD